VHNGTVIISTRVCLLFMIAMLFFLI
jgi:hypothetical protein